MHTVLLDGIRIHFLSSNKLINLQRGPKGEAPRADLFPARGVADLDLPGVVGTAPLPGVVGGAGALEPLVDAPPAWKEEHAGALTLRADMAAARAAAGAPAEGLAG